MFLSSSAAQIMSQRNRTSHCSSAEPQRRLRVAYSLFDTPAQCQYTLSHQQKTYLKISPCFFPHQKKGHRSINRTSDILQPSSCGLGCLTGFHTHQNSFYFAVLSDDKSYHFVCHFSSQCVHMHTPFLCVGDCTMAVKCHSVPFCFQDSLCRGTKPSHRLLL